MTAGKERMRSPISRAEMERRWSLVRRMMDDRGLDALVMQNSSDWVGGYVRWFTDVAATNGYPRTVIFYRDAPATLIMMGAFDGERKLDGNDPENPGIGRMLFAPSFVSAAMTNGYDAALMVADLKRSGARSVGVLTPGALPHAVMRALTEDLPGVAISDASDAVDEIKAVKSPEEIALLYKVAQLQDAVFAAVCNYIRPGLRDIDISTFAQAEGHRLGSDQGIYLGTSAPLGASARFAQRGMQGRRLDKGDHFALLIEVNGPCGLYVEIARTMILGKATAHLQDNFALMLEAQAHSLSLMKPGVPAAEVAEAHDRWMVAHGLSPEKRIYAHGQGVDMVERPLIRRDETMLLAEGMCLAVHPGFDDGKAFSVICDNYMVERDGMSACMHQTEKRLFEID